MQNSDHPGLFKTLFILVFCCYFIIFGDTINIAKLNLNYAQPTLAAEAFTEAVTTADPADEAAADPIHGT
jgi:hypothetical protein